MVAAILLPVKREWADSNAILAPEQVNGARCVAGGPAERFVVIEKDYW